MVNLKIVITGSTGFIGTNLTNRLIQKNIPFLVFDRKKHDFLRPETFIDLVKNANIIFHLASILDQTPEGYDFNVNSTKNLLKVVSEVAPKSRIIFTSSFAVYKIPQKGQIVDENFSLKPRNSYGLSKLKCEQLLTSNKVESISLRLSNVYGQSSKPINHSVISNFIHQIESGENIKIYGDGSQERDFLYIDDVIDALLLASHLKKISPQVMNICSNTAVSMIKLISMIETVLGKEASKEFIAAPKGDGGYWRGGNTLAQKTLNWEPKIKLTQGLQLTISRSKTIN